MRRWLVMGGALLCVAGLAGMALAEEGMWLFNVPPTAAVQSK